MVPFESDNVATYRLLLRIEIALRELIRQAYEAEFGSRWRRRIPGQLLQRIRAAESDDDSKKQYGFRRLGPLYYLTFGDLLTMLRQRPCRSMVAAMGGPSFVAQVENLASPRNAICHARAIPSAAVLAAQALYAQLENGCSQTRLRALLASPDVGLDPAVVRSQCASWLRELQHNLPRLHAPLPTLPDHEKAASQYWWGDLHLADFDTHAIDAIATLVQEYNALPVAVGSAAARRRFLQTHDLPRAVEAALRTLAPTRDDHAHN